MSVDKGIMKGERTITEFLFKRKEKNTSNTSKKKLDSLEQENNSGRLEVDYETPEKRPKFEENRRGGRGKEMTCLIGKSLRKGELTE